MAVRSHHIPWGTARKEFIAVRKDAVLYFSQGCSIRETYKILVQNNGITMSYVTFASYVHNSGIRKSSIIPSKKTGVVPTANEPRRQPFLSETKDNTSQTQQSDAKKTMPNRWDDNASILENLTKNSPTAADLIG